jgi:hypothetical protein
MPGLRQASFYQRRDRQAIWREGQPRKDLKRGTIVKLQQQSRRKVARSGLLVPIAYLDFIARFELTEQPRQAADYLTAGGKKSGGSCSQVVTVSSSLHCS